MSFDTAMNEFAKVCRILNELEKAAFSTASTNYHTLEKTLIKSLDGYRIANKTRAIRNLRPALNGLLTPETVRQVLTPYAASVVEEIGKNSVNFETDMVTIRDYMEAQSKSVKSRVPTIGAYSVLGNGTTLRQDRDRHNNVGETYFPEAFSFECAKDKGTGTREHQEVFTWKGATQGEDAIEDAGSGQIENALELVDELSSKNLFSNPSFTSFNGTAPSGTAPAGTDVVAPSTTAFPGWTLSAAASFKASLNRTYRDRKGQTNQKSLLCVANGWFKQQLNGDNAPKKINFKDNAAYAWVGRIYKPAGVTGNLDFTFGANTFQITIAGLTADAFSVRHILSQGATNATYYRAFKTDDLFFKCEISALSLGGAPGVYFDDFELVEMTHIHGMHHHIAGGNVADSLGTLYTHTASSYAATRGVVQYWASFRTRLSEQLGFAFFLPHVADGSETVTDVQ